MTDEDLYPSTVATALGDIDAAAESTPPVPRVWTVFAVAGLCLVGTIAIQIAVVVALIMSHAVSGRDPGLLLQDLPTKLAAPSAFIILGLLSQMVMGLAAWVPALLSPQPLRLRLGLGRSNLPAAAYPLVMVGSLLPAALGIYVAHLVSLAIPPDPTVKMLYEQMTWPWAIPFLIFISVAPGIMEELFFRGYMQRRLLERWNPFAAIMVTSVIFGIFHVTPHAVPMATIIGIWLGILAWRTGSVYPGMFCHAFINGAWNVWQIGVVFELLPESPPYGVTMIGAVIMVVCFLLSAVMIFHKPVAEPELSTAS